tara:strand:- start:233552 stop:234445 length:894 start_codon:yes stop_codon:yes gene_type:complete
MQSVKDGVTKNYILQPARFRLDGGAMFGIIPKPLWNKVMPADEFNRIDLALRLWLIKKNDRVILTDTGIGDYHGDQFDQRFDVRGTKSPLEKCLEKINIRPEEITDLIISHLHFDHVGGISKLNTENVHEPLFANATLHLHKKHFDYSQNPTQRDGGSFHTKTFLPIVDYYQKNNQIKFYEEQEGSLEIDSVDMQYKCSHGHTPWLMHPYNDQFIYLSDIIPTSNHINIPWVMGYDIAAGESTRNKVEFLELMMEKDLLGIYEHDPKFWGSKIKKDDKGRYIPNLLEKAKEENYYLI